jgi:hypothetical protein
VNGYFYESRSGYDSRFRPEHIRFEDHSLVAVISGDFKRKLQLKSGGVFLLTF